MNKQPCPRGIMCPFQNQNHADHVRQFSHSSSPSPHLAAMGLNFAPPHQHQPQPQPQPALFHHAVVVGGGGRHHALVVGGGGGGGHALVVGGRHHALVVGGGGGGGGHALVVGGGGGGGHPGGPCKYWSHCIRSNPLHLAKYSHPPGHVGGGGHHGRGHAGGGGHHGGGGGGGRGRGGGGLVLIHPDYSGGSAVFMVETQHGCFELPYGGCDHGEGPFRCAVREVKEETKGVFDVSSTRQRLECLTSSRYANQCVYVANVEPAPGQEKGLYTRQMFARNHRVLRRIGAGPEFFETSGIVRVRIADLQHVFAANAGLGLVGTNGETGVLRSRDASYLRNVLASNLHLTAPTLHSTFVRDVNGLETYHLH